ncbi:G-protein coupled receptor 4-like isoform X3 [Epinephelus fuscoguttatus]|uniref:G-protein coupled receptor 4-like isoform X3 n=1 Tax=Epinephelus fuscoguttatus TaxID=293821 RepID=UPI0020D13B64|nr:G-protein coupled receptor 4-like isoform X3 [Epinephelus fuscoguttatus]XP_049456160.1 G-protein coupled receptor 4-like isoform X3 [Epinephelus fuscoguttatus]XP_049456161.1 G-protein coupled receptor 4-like isoform X3 [Epinephelus fuscoguttatus]XP_049456162.1 G-protein coupled receptor 4-like isoform X3 [Epinephelus fuscoguttatus]
MDDFIMKVVTIIIICIGLPLTLVAICAVSSLVKDDHVVPIYVINLLITDLIQLCCMIALVLPKDWILSGGFILLPIYGYCLVASIGFMVCIALERYLVIACPLWYRFRRTIKVSVLVCVVVWALPAVISCLLSAARNPATIHGILLLLPLPLFIFFLGGTLKALSASISVHSDEKRRIVGMLVLVLLIYTLLFLPTIILSLAWGSSVIDERKLSNLSLTFVQFSPLADLFLYIFMRKGTIDKLLASVCCCRMDSDDISSPV